MKTYLVEWCIQLDAESPRQAAELAREVQLDPGSMAVVFEVDGKQIDLLDEDWSKG